MVSESEGANMHFILLPKINFTLNFPIVTNKHVTFAVIYAGFFGWGGSTKCLGGSDFSMVERIFTIGQSPKICGNFSKICIKINKKLKEYWENSRKNANFFRRFF